MSTTGSLVTNTVAGLSDKDGPSITFVRGNPDGILTVPDVSGLAIDYTNGNVYIFETAGGTTWYKLGSTT